MGETRFQKGEKDFQKGVWREKMMSEELLQIHGARRRTDKLKLQLAIGGNFDTVAGIFQLLDDGSRVRIFWLLCHCEECVLNISEITGLTSPAASHHLRLLKEAGLIESRRDGKEVYYRAADTPTVKLLHRAIEKMMEISCPELTEPADENPTGFSPEQIAIVRQMHDDLMRHPAERHTIDELSHRCLMNPTTLKAVFKAVYGDSLASHMKEHRLEKAAELLRKGDESISEIAAKVGYDSSSRFSSAFRERYHMLPTEYRKQLKSGRGKT